MSASGREAYEAELENESKGMRFLLDCDFDFQEWLAKFEREELLNSVEESPKSKKETRL